MLNSQFVFRPGTSIGEKFNTRRAESLSKIPLRVHTTTMFRPGSMVQPQEPILYDFDKINEARAAKYGTKVHLDGQAPLYTIDSVDENGNTITKTVSMGEMGKDITTNLQELIKAVSSNSLSEQIKISALEEAFSSLDSMTAGEVQNLTTEKQKLIGLLAKKLNDGKVSKPGDLGIVPKYTTKEYIDDNFPVILSYLCANQDQKGKVVMNDYGTKLNIPELVKSMKDTDILDLNNKRLISSTNFYDMYKKGQISGIIDNEDAINFINDKYAWKIDEEDKEAKQRDEEKKLFLEKTEEEYGERQTENKMDKKAKEAYVENAKKRFINRLKDNAVYSKNERKEEEDKLKSGLLNRLGMSPEQANAIIDDLKNTMRGKKDEANETKAGLIKTFDKSFAKEKADKFRKKQLLKEAFKGFVKQRVADIESKYETPIKSSKEPVTQHKNLKQAVSHLLKTTKPTATVQTLFEPVIKGNFKKKEGTKKEVYEGVAKYHKSKGVKKYKQDMTLRNDKAVLR